MKPIYEPSGKAKEYGDCPNCPAADLCDKYKDYQCEAREEEVENG